MNILGIDPGLRNLGWGIISVDDETGGLSYVNSGLIKTDVKQPYGASLDKIRFELGAIMGNLKIHEIGIEDIHAMVSRNMGSLKGTNYVIGVIHQLAVYLGSPEPYLISPSRMKKVLTGDGRANKVTVLEAVVQSLQLTRVVMRGKAPAGVVKAGHAVDALAIALATEQLHLRGDVCSTPAS